MTTISPEMKVLFAERGNNKPFTEVLTGPKIRSMPRQYFLRIARLMSSVYAGPPFHEVGISESGEVLGFDQIRERYPDYQGTRDNFLLDLLRTGQIDGVKPYYDVDTTAQIIRRQSELPGVQALHANIFSPNNTDPLAHTAGYVCSDTRINDAGSSALDKVGELITMMPYGAAHKDSVRDFLNEVDSIDIRGRKVLLLGELCVDPNEQGKGFGRKVTSALSPHIFIESQSGRGILERPSVFITEYREDMTEADLSHSAMGRNVFRAKKSGIPVVTRELGNSGMSIVYTTRGLEMFVPELRWPYTVARTIFGRK